MSPLKCKFIDAGTLSQILGRERERETKLEIKTRSLPLEAQGTLQKRGEKNYKSQWGGGQQVNMAHKIRAHRVSQRLRQQSDPA